MPVGSAPPPWVAGSRPPTWAWTSPSTGATVWPRAPEVQRPDELLPEADSTRVDRRQPEARLRQLEAAEAELRKTLAELETAVSALRAEPPPVVPASAVSTQTDHDWGALNGALHYLGLVLRPGSPFMDEMFRLRDQEPALWGTLPGRLVTCGHRVRVWAARVPSGSDSDALYGLEVAPEAAAAAAARTATSTPPTGSED